METTMAVFSVVLLTAAPAGMAGEAGGAFVKIDGRESLLRSVELFLNRENVKQIQICFLPDELEEAKRKYAPHLSFSGVKVISGGPRWIDQIAAAKGKIILEATHVIVHDAARPAVAYSDIEALMEHAEKHDAVVLASASRAPLVEVDEGGNAVAVHHAGHFMQLLTPQAYSVKKFDEIASSKQEPHASQLTLLKGSPLNVRLGGPGDATLVRAMINMLPKPKIKAADNPFEEAQW
jgi:2-C-methyl-D-erythritol 4-phosphate cytidylyltransferase